MAKKKKLQTRQNVNTLQDTVWNQERQRQETSTIFFYHPQDDWGFLGLWYQCSFRGPPPGRCEDFPDCHQCQAERKQFSSIGQYVEHYKALHFKDQRVAEKILNASTVDEVMALSKTITGFKEYVWDELRYDCIVQANVWKFSEDGKCVANDDDAFAYGRAGRQKDDERVLFRELLASTTTRELVAASAHDKIWGIGFPVEDARKHDEDERSMWGKNLLGRALMEVRGWVQTQERLRAEQNPH